MRNVVLGSLSALVLVACQTGLQPPQTASDHLADDGGPRMGPPPPDYVKIRGEAVPGWKSSDMQARFSSPISWQPMGPRPIVEEFWSGNDDASGRVVSIAPHPSDPDVAYAGSASGGVWKTTDGGLNWAPMTDELSNLNHGCVALDPQVPDTVYAGTGEYTTQAAGDGVFRSTDAGATWERIATTADVGTTCSRIVVDPSDSLYVHLTGNNGYVRSTDGGATWTVDPGILGGSRASDLAIDPATPSTLFAGRHGDGLYRSTDAGATWSKLTSGLPASVSGRVMVAVAASNPSVAYTAMLNGSNLQGLYKTTDGGNTWANKPNTPNFPSPQGSYDVFLGVDPGDSERLYGGGVFPSYAVAGVIRSTDGGDSWLDITLDGVGGQLHPDQHAVAFGPGPTMWVGNDGGVWKSTNAGDTWINTNATLSVTQNYTVALHPTDPLQMMTGTQDNGTVARDLATEDWPQILAGDGGYLAYDTSDPNRRYVTYVRLTVYRLVGASVSEITGPWAADPRAFIAPLTMDPNDPRTLVGGTNRVWRTQNADTAATWTAISTNAVGGGGVLNAIAVAEGASNTLYVGSSTGRLSVTTDASNWDDRSAGLPGGQISDILIDPNDTGTAYVGFYNTFGARVLRTTDFGASWQDLTGTLPTGVGARALAVDWRYTPATLFVGTGVGVYWTADDGLTWTKDGTDLPNVNIGDLAIDFQNDAIVAGTYGRGAWRADLLPGTPIFEDGFESGNTSAWSQTVP